MIAMEALTNTFKHANASKVSLSLNDSKNAIDMVVRDDGVGFDAQEVMKRKNSNHWGLTIMHERAKAVKADFFLDSEPGQHTTIKVKLIKGK